MRFVLPFLILPALAACGEANGEAQGKGGPAVTRSYDVRDFDGVALMGPDNVKIVQGKEFAVTGTGPADILADINVRVENGTLKIGHDKDGDWGFRWSGKHDDKAAQFTVTMPELRKATLAGSGDMVADTTATDNFSGSIAGSGNLTIAKVAANDADFNVAGSGNLDVKGASAKAKYSVAGSGDVDASGLQAGDVDVSIAGSGNVRAHASGKASVSIVGSGDVEIAGSKDCTVSKIGSGNVNCGS